MVKQVLRTIIIPVFKLFKITLTNKYTFREPYFNLKLSLVFLSLVYLIINYFIFG